MSLSLLDTGYAMIVSGKRLIGTILPEVTVEEMHTDRLMITDHPVEKGAAVSDHAFMLPYEVNMRVGWSNSTAQSEGYAQQVYEALRVLQQKREPFTVYTGKRKYTDMLIAAIIVTTDERTENVLMAQVSLRQIIITNTSSTGSTGGKSNDVTGSTPKEAGTKSVKVISEWEAFEPSPVGTPTGVPDQFKTNPYGGISSPGAFGITGPNAYIAPGKF